MPATYRCGSCNATWSDDFGPSGCPKCGSPNVERKGLAGELADPFAPPSAAIGLEAKPNSTSFAICYWVGWVAVIAGYATIITAGIQNAQAQQLDPQAKMDPTLAGVGMLLAAVGLVFLMTATIVSFVKLYRGWKVIQPLRRLDRAEADMPTPGKAVGLLFVPFWNLYWIFVAIRGLAVKANRYKLLAGIQGKPMSEGLAQAYCVLTLCGLIPFVGILLALPNLVVYYLFILDIDRMRGVVAAGRGAESKLTPGLDFEPV